MYYIPRCTYAYTRINSILVRARVSVCNKNQQMFSLFVFQRIPSFALRKQEQWTITP